MTPRTARAAVERPAQGLARFRGGGVRRAVPFFTPMCQMDAPLSLGRRAWAGVVWGGTERVKLAELPEYGGKSGLGGRTSPNTRRLK